MQRFQNGTRRYAAIECALAARLNNRSIRDRIAKRNPELDHIGPAFFQRAQNSRQFGKTRIARRYEENKRLLATRTEVCKTFGQQRRGTRRATSFAQTTK